MSTPEEQLGPRGRRLWTAIAARDPQAVEATEPRCEIAIEACRCCDQLDELAVILDRDGLVIDGSQTGVAKAHPALVQTGIMRTLLARLIVALALPDEVTGARRRPHSLHGVQAPSKIGSTATLKAIDRAARAGTAK